MIILIIILLILIFWYYTRDFYTKPQITNLKLISDKIIEKAKISPKPKFRIYETNDYPYTVNNDIYIVTKRKNGRRYDPDSIMMALCHELAHVLSGVGDEHGHIFEKWENILLEVAEDLGFYYKGINIVEDYPCYH